VLETSHEVLLAEQGRFAAKGLELEQAEPAAEIPHAVLLADAEMAAKDGLAKIYHTAMDNMQLLFGGAEAVLQPIYRRVSQSLLPALEVKLDEDVTATSPVAKSTLQPEVPEGPGPAFRRRLGKRLLPEPEPRPLPRRRKLTSSKRDQPLPPYTVESLLFEQLVHESVSLKVSAAQMQYLLGVTVRAEPLWAEPSLGCLGACSLPVRNDFFPWDSTLEAVKNSAKNWPCVPELFDTNAAPPPMAPGVGGGLLEGHENPASYEIGKPSTDPLAVVSRFFPLVGDRRKAEALGPRLLRIRKLGGHPSLSLTPSGRCANSAFCVRPAIMPDGAALTGPGPFKCTQCECAWYCSSACQSLHTTAHSFECQALKSLRTAANSFESRGLERTTRSLASLLEHILAKQFSMVAKQEALVGCTALSEDLLTAIYGSSQASPPHPNAGDDSDSDGSVNARSSVTGATSNHTGMVGKEDPSKMPKVLRNSKLKEWSQMVVMPEDFKQWSVELELSNFEEVGGGGTHNKRQSMSGGSILGDASRGSALASSLTRGSLTAQENLAAQDGRSSGSGKARTVPRGLFDVKQTHAHTAAGVVRLLLRWVNVMQRSPALREVIDAGFIFCLITGLCETRHFSKRRLSKHGVVSVLAHRMALHVAASQQWRTLAPSLGPPRQLLDQGLQGIECAQYTAYYAFLRPRRLPFSQLRPMLPIVCLVWGDAARDALLDLPHKRESNESSTSVQTPTGLTAAAVKTATSPMPLISPKGGPHASMEGLLETTSEKLQRAGAWRPSKGKCLTSFMEVASDHLAQIQLIDSVNLDVLTGKVSFLMYTAAVDSARAPDADASVQATVLLLDSSRGMQVVASPLPARELRRCAL